MMPISAAALTRYRQPLTEILEHLKERLQAPCFGPGTNGSLTFDETLAETARLTGVPVYRQERQSRELYRQGRITDADLAAAFAAYPRLNAETPVAGIRREAVYRIVLLYGLPPLTDSQRHWQYEELDALTRLQADVPASARRELLAGGEEADAVGRLWRSLADKLELDQAVAPKSPLGPTVDPERHNRTRQQAECELEQLIAGLGVTSTLRGWVLALSGTDILDDVRPQLLRLVTSALDEGVAGWHLPNCAELGFYLAWRETLRYDANPFLQQWTDWQEIVAELPEQALDAIALQLLRLGIPEQRWDGYLQCLALELRGWSTLISRRHADLTLADYFALRLVLDRLWLNQVCHEHWRIEAKLGALTLYFRKNLSEFLVRKRLYQGRLPEYLAASAEALIISAGSERQRRGDWQQLADWLHDRPFDDFGQPSATDTAWRLFRLCQHLGVNAERVTLLEKVDLLAMLATADEFDAAERGKIWLYALEHHYRQDLLQALQISREPGRRTEHDDPTSADANPVPSPPRKWPVFLQAPYKLWQPPLNHRLAASYLAVNALAPFALLALIGETLWPQPHARLIKRLFKREKSRPLADKNRQAALIIARPALTECLSEDLRVLSLGYDPGQDGDGCILEKILLAVLPTAIGVNLDDYLADVGCNDDEDGGYYTLHTSTTAVLKETLGVGGFDGMEAVAEPTGMYPRRPLTGASLPNFDQRRVYMPGEAIGLSRQAAHDAVRLNLVVEASPSLLAAIIDRQDKLRALVNGRWLYLIVIDPDDGGIVIFERGFFIRPIKHDAANDNHR